MKLIKLTQFKTETEPLRTIFVNPSMIHTIEYYERTKATPIIGDGDKNRIILSHIIFAPGNQGRLVTESLEEIERLLDAPYQRECAERTSFLRGYDRVRQAVPVSPPPMIMPDRIGFCDIDEIMLTHMPPPIPEKLSDNIKTYEPMHE